MKNKLKQFAIRDDVIKEPRYVEENSKESISQARAQSAETNNGTIGYEYIIKRGNFQTSGDE